MTEKPVGIVIPTWNPNEPRFIVEDAHDGLADDRAFKNGKFVYNQRLGVVYNVEYVVDALNELGDEIDKLKEENEQLRQELDNFKPVMFQDIRKGTVILYSKGD